MDVGWIIRRCNCLCLCTFIQGTHTQAHVSLTSRSSTAFMSLSLPDSFISFSAKIMAMMGPAMVLFLGEGWVFEEINSTYASVDGPPRNAHDMKTNRPHETPNPRTLVVRDPPPIQVPVQGDHAEGVRLPGALRGGDDVIVPAVSWWVGWLVCAWVPGELVRIARSCVRRARQSDVVRTCFAANMNLSSISMV